MKKIKIYSFIGLILGLTLVLVSVLVPIIKISNYTAQNGSIGIIGGADTPTFQFLVYSIFGGFPIYTLTFGITLTIASLLCFIFRKAVEKYCTLKTTLFSLFISFSGSLGLMCLLFWYSIVVFREMSKHPIAYSASVILGCLSFLLFIFLIIIYCKARKENFFLKGILIDIATSVLALPLFFMICSACYGLLQKII